MCDPPSGRAGPTGLLIALLTCVGLMLPSGAWSEPPGEPAAPSADARRRMEYAQEHGAEHPGPAVDALLGALALESPASRGALVAEIERTICGDGDALAPLCRDAALAARLADWRPPPPATKPARRATKRRVRKRPKPARTKPTPREPPPAASAVPFMKL